MDVAVFAFSAVPTFAVYFDFKYLFNKCSCCDTASKIITEVGGASFGVYLLHGILIRYTDFIRDFLNTSLPDGISGLVYTTLVFAVCTAVVIPLRKIPLINKLI